MSALRAAWLVFTQQKQDMSSLNLNLSLQSMIEKNLLIGNHHTSISFFCAETMIMLVAGHTTGNKKNLRPWFLSLNTNMAPLPACLTGSKNNIDNFQRVRAPLIYGHGMYRDFAQGIKCCGGRKWWAGILLLKLDWLNVIPVSLSTKSRGCR